VAGYVGEGYEIQYRWKEEVVYWEGSNGFLLDAGWGVDPPVLYVPSAASWADVMPDWCRDRRAEIVARLRGHSGHQVRDDDNGYGRALATGRMLTR